MEATGKAVWSMTQEILDAIKGASYEEGIRDALSELAEIYDGIDGTDLWSQYMQGEGN